MSRVEPWLSDALCRLATGGGFGTRELHGDGEEVLFDAMRPILLNGIEEAATRPDLLDRAVLLQLPAIPEHRRRLDSDMDAGFERAAPRILGAVLDAVAASLRRRREVKLERLPRMADCESRRAARSPRLTAGRSSSARYWPPGRLWR